MYYDYYLYYLSYLDSMYNGYPLIIRMTVVMVMFLILITVFGFLRLLYVGYKINRRDKRRSRTRIFFEEKLTFVMSSKTNYDVEELQELLEYDVAKTKRWKSDLLTDLVLSVKDAVYKEGVLNLLNYKNCIEALRLMGFWEKRIRTSGLEKRREALQIVGQFDRGINSGILSKSTFHKNNDLRKTARDLHTSQDSYNPFRFMEDNFDESFSQLDKLRLHSTLIKRSKEGQLPNLLRWINNSKKVNYVIFVLREIGFFKQYEAAPSLVDMLDIYENKDVRAQVILTLGELGYAASTANLIKRYTLESNAVRDAIITAMGKFTGQDALDFLTYAYHSTEDIRTKLIVARSIKAHGKNGEDTLQLLLEEARKKTANKEDVLLEQVFAEHIIIPA